MHFQVACLTTTTTWLEFSLTNYKSIGIVWSSFVFKGYTVSLTCLKAEVLWDGLVNQVTTANQSVSLEWPISIDNIIDFLTVPTTLCIWIVFFRQVSPVVFDTFDTTHYKWEDSLSYIFKVLFEGSLTCIMLVPVHAWIVFEGTNFIKVSCFITSFTTQCQSDIWYVRSSCKEGVHVLEVTCIINCSIFTTIVMSISFDIVESEWLIGVGSHFFLASIHCDTCLSITTVINTDINRILGIWFQASQFLSKADLALITLDTKHFICTLWFDNFCLRCITRNGPVFQGSTVKSLVIDVHAFAPWHFRIGLFWTVENVWLICSKIKGNLTIFHSYFLFFSLTLVS